MALSKTTDDHNDLEVALITALDDYVEDLVYTATNDPNMDNPHTITFLDKIVPLLLQPIERSVKAVVDLYKREGLSAFNGK